VSHHGLVRIVVEVVMWVLPWIGVLAVSAGLALAMTLGVVDVLGREPETSVSIAPAASMDQLDVARPTQLLPSEADDYVGLNTWIHDPNAS
jgi:hypothetical protein